MASSYTPRIALPQMADGELSGFVTFNELAQYLDALLHPVVQSKVTTTPPGTPAEGECWYVPVGGTGAWAGHDTEVAQYYDAQWHFYVVDKVQMWVVDEAAMWVSP